MVPLDIFHLCVRESCEEGRSFILKVNAIFPVWFQCYTRYQTSTCGTSCRQWAESNCRRTFTLKVSAIRLTCSLHLDAGPRQVGPGLAGSS